MQPRPSLCFYDDFDGVLFVGGLIGEIGPTNKLDFFPQPVDADVSSQSEFLGGRRTAKCQESKNWTLELKNIEKQVGLAGGFL